MTRLRAAVWGLFLATALLNAAYAGVMFTLDMPALGVLSSVTAILAVLAAILLHLVANAYQAELDRLADASEGLERLAQAVDERRRQPGSGPEQ